MQAVRVWNSAIPADHYGTVGCLVRWGDAPGLLSASHVLAPIWTGVSVGAHHSVSSLPGGAVAGAELTNWDVPMTSDGAALPGSLDAAFATVDAQTERKLLDSMGLPTGVRPAQEGIAAYFFGSTSGRCKRTMIHDVRASISMGYRLYHNDQTLDYHEVDVSLSGLIQCDSIEQVEAGDSGCLLFDSEGYALGLLLGTDANSIYPYFAPLQPILDLFRLKLVTSTDHPDVARLAELVR